MIIFQRTRTKRLSVALRELSLGQSIALCKLPADRYEAAVTEFLRFAATADRPSDQFVTDPLLWTVEERTLLVVKYLAQVVDDGPNFAIDAGHLSDYVQFDADLPAAETDLGLVAGKPCRMVPLLGGAAQALEILCKSRVDWILGAIACQVRVGEEAMLDWATASDTEAMAWITGRMGRLRELAESDFSEVYGAFWSGRDRLGHFFNLDFDDKGVIVVPERKEEVGLAPARFPADLCVSQLARSLAG